MLLQGGGIAYVYAGKREKTAEIDCKGAKKGFPVPDPERDPSDFPLGI